MTDATVLADALVEAGIGERDKYIDPCFVVFDGEPLFESSFITDWRVAGKVLESMSKQQLYLMFAANSYLVVQDPRAIIEAWYGARR